MIEKGKALPLTKQCTLLEVNRTSLYYQRKGVSAGDLALMRALDELHLRYPFMGSRMLLDQLHLQGFAIGRYKVLSLMRKMRFCAITRQRKTTQKCPQNPIYPYLLRNVGVTRPNQVWATDITYIPMRRGFVYCIAVMDWYSRKVLAHKIAINMETDNCVEVLKEALKHYGKPEIFNSDQGSQFTSGDFTAILREHHIKISMDGKGAWRDNVFVERLWKSLKYEEVYLKAYETVAEARQQIGEYFAFYNAKRPHSSLDKQTPNQAYLNNQSPLKLAA